MITVERILLFLLVGGVVAVIATMLSEPTTFIVRENESDENEGDC